jgi:hypothetical protein
MRLDSRLGDHDWDIFDVERCARVEKPVVWVDDESATWGEHDPSLMAAIASALFGIDATITHYEKRIRILCESRMVFNPLPDADVRDSEELPVVRDVVERKQGQRA